MPDKSNKPKTKRLKLDQNSSLLDIAKNVKKLDITKINLSDIKKEKNIGFEITHKDTNSKARIGLLKTVHGDFETPYFMAVATKATGKYIGPDDYNTCTEGIICNALVLSLRPGSSQIKKFGGIHKFMNYDKPVFTDCGGFQMVRESFMQDRSKKGIHFKSPFDGKRFVLTPEKIMNIETDIGADCIMMLDDLAPYGSTKEEFERSVENTHNWGTHSLILHSNPDQFLYGIVQGGFFKDLREKSAKYIGSLPFDGLAIGGVAIGETREEMYDAIHAAVPFLPENKPKHLLGVGSPDDIVECVSLGMDTFDSIFPTQNARHGTIFTWDGRLDLMSAQFESDENSIDANCTCLTCKTYTRAYIRHLLKLGEGSGRRYAQIHNLQFMKDLMQKIRLSIKDGTFIDLKTDIIKKYRKNIDPKNLIGVKVKR
jgi:queuine tRNA-ribosyltransferase